MAGIISLNAVFQFAGLQVATDGSYAAAFGEAGSDALVLLLLNIQHYGTLAAQVYFGLWLAPLGYLAYTSGMFPKALGVALVVATVSYLVDVLAAFLAPGLAQQIHLFLGIAPAISEIWMVLYLLVKGVKSSSTADRSTPWQSRFDDHDLRNRAVQAAWHGVADHATPSVATTILGREEVRFTCECPSLGRQEP